MEPVEVLDQSGSQSESEEPFPTDRDDDNHEAGPGLGAEQWVQWTHWGSLTALGTQNTNSVRGICLNAESVWNSVSSHVIGQGSI
jgi:hypothetical protein